jgi:hypothetical protein
MNSDAVRGWCSCRSRPIAVTGREAFPRPFAISPCAWPPSASSDPITVLYGTRTRAQGG